MSTDPPHWFGDRAVLVPLSAADDRAAYAGSLAALLPECVVRPGMASVLIEAREPDSGLLDAVHDALAHREHAAGVTTTGGFVEIAVTYGGADLDAVAQLLGRGAQDVVDAHQRQVWSVAMVGFAPGFGYLVPVGAAVMPWEALPRLDRARPRVPAGSVAVAAGMSAIYPVDMPGGWHLIGTSPARLFDPDDARRPTLLRTGDTVRFIEVR